MNKNEFKKLSYCLELLAITELISDKKKLSKKKLLNYGSFECFYQKEFDKFIECAEEEKIRFKKLVTSLTRLNYTDAIKFAKENKENYIGLYDLHYTNHNTGIICYIKGTREEYIDIVEKILRKKAKEIFESLVTE